MPEPLLLQYQINTADIDAAMLEIRQYRRSALKFIQHGIWGSVLITFIAYVVFSSTAATSISASIYQILIAFVIYSLLIAYAHSQLINKIVESTIYRKGEPTKHTLTIASKDFKLGTKYITYNLKLDHFETITTKNKFIHLEWSAKKALNLRKIGIISIPRRAFVNKTMENDFLERFEKSGVTVGR